MSDHWQDVLRILNWRLDNGLSLRRAAKELGVNYKTLWRWEKGLHKPSALALRKVLNRIQGAS